MSSWTVSLLILKNATVLKDHVPHIVSLSGAQMAEELPGVGSIQLKQKAKMKVLGNL